ncbi:hypothetical protein [Salinispora arenicola]|uniref:hypothetical protein n=1 Tax=Salinispora arenicola TaxID=168697 RepID=UPI0027DB6B6D|nr:hypothetical protein [Salinispora arenicola]
MDYITALQQAITRLEERGIVDDTEAQAGLRLACLAFDSPDVPSQQWALLGFELLTALAELYPEPAPIAVTVTTARSATSVHHNATDPHPPRLRAGGRLRPGESAAGGVGPAPLRLRRDSRAVERCGARFWCDVRKLAVAGARRAHPRASTPTVRFGGHSR